MRGRGVAGGGLAGAKAHCGRLSEGLSWAGPGRSPVATGSSRPTGFHLQRVCGAAKLTEAELKKQVETGNGVDDEWSASKARAELVDVATGERAISAIALYVYRISIRPLSFDLAFRISRCKSSKSFSSR